MHPEGGESPFVVRDRNANVDESQDSESAGETVGHMDNDKDEDEDDDDEKYQHCPVDGCDEWLVPADMEDHLQLHADEAELDSPSPARMQASSAATDSPRSTSAQPREKDKDRRTSRSLPPTPPHDRGREREREREREHARAKSPRSNRRADAVQIWRSILNMPGPKAKAKLESQQPNKATSTQGKRLGVCHYRRTTGLTPWRNLMLTSYSTEGGTGQVRSREENAGLASLTVEEGRPGAS